MKWLLTVLVLIISKSASADQLCTELGGICSTWSNNFCTAGWVRGLCDNDPVRRCCLNCGVQCVAAEANFAQNSDVTCVTSSGRCQDTSNYCLGNYDVTISCGGGVDRQCCLSQPQQETDCPIVEYTPTLTITSRDSNPILVHRNFVELLNEVDSIAQETGVIVEVTKSFIRRASPTSRSRVLVPGRRNNHVVGHAIDFNIRTQNGNCGRNCIEGRSNVNANAFVDRIDVHPILTRAANHIDDRFDLEQNWKLEVRKAQNNCF